MAMVESNWDVVVIGAGAAGLLAAICSAEEGARTLLLEKNSRPGVKILMSGGTRCNITHATDNRGIVEAFGGQGRFLHSALAALGVEGTIQLFEAEGVATKVEETGKVFPVSNRAIDVLDALLRRLQRSGAVLALNEPVVDLRPVDGSMQVQTKSQVIQGTSVILTTGGKSYPGSGTTGDGYAFVGRLGHQIIPPRPALVPVRVRSSWVNELRGVTLPDVVVRVLHGETCLTHRRGSLLFAHFGLSGPVVLDVSRSISGHDQPEQLLLQIDFVPDTRQDELDEQVRMQTQAAGKKLLAVLLADIMPRRLADTLLLQAGLGLDRKSAALSRSEREALVRALKRCELPVLGTLGFGKAEVTAGGVDLREVDSRSMRSTKVPHLYLAGEILDLDGPIGGYNFQAAFSTGWLAGASAARVAR